MFCFISYFNYVLSFKHSSFRIHFACYTYRNIRLYRNRDGALNLSLYIGLQSYLYFLVFSCFVLYRSKTGSKCPSYISVHIRVVCFTHAEKNVSVAFSSETVSSNLNRNRCNGDGGTEPRLGRRSSWVTSVVYNCPMRVAFGQIWSTCVACGPHTRTTRSRVKSYGAVVLFQKWDVMAKIQSSFSLLHSARTQSVLDWSIPKATFVFWR